VEAGYRIGLDDPALDIDLSEQYVISCLAGGCSGGLIEVVLARLENEGVPDEGCFPYTGRDMTPCSSRCLNWSARTRKIAGWSWIIPPYENPQDAVKRHLQDGPIITAMVIYADIWAYSGGIYEHVWGDAEGFHALLLVGWDEDGWIAKNSWGLDWGIDGYLRIKYGEVGIASYGAQVYINETDVPAIQGFMPGCGCEIIN
jgi:hypothetical protein